MGFFNKVVMLGNITRNPEVRYLPGSNTPVAKFGLAVNRRYRQNNEVKEETCFIDIVTFSKLAEFAGEFITKGISILVEGRLHYRTWEQEGIKKSKHEVIAENIQLVWKKNDASKENSDTSEEHFQEGDIDENNIPF
jgi:single-strand DNA-binding protein